MHIFPMTRQALLNLSILILLTDKSYIIHVIIYHYGNSIIVLKWANNNLQRNSYVPDICMHILLTDS